jgi:hypothetical protein
LADLLDKAAGHLGVVLGARQEVDAELEPLWISAARVLDLVLDNADGLSSLAASKSTTVVLLEGWIDATSANGVHLGSHSMLVESVSNFPELRLKMELLGSGRNVDLTEDEADAL